MSIVNNNKKDENYKKFPLSQVKLKIYEIFQNKNKTENNYFAIDTKEAKLYDFFLKLSLNSKQLKTFFKLNKKFYNKDKSYIKINKKEKAEVLSEKIMPKFFLSSFFNSDEISNILGYNKKKFVTILFEIIQIFFLNNLMNRENLVEILKSVLLSSLKYEENINIKEEEIKLKDKNIYNFEYFEIVIKFLLSFKTIKMEKKENNIFTNIINDVISIIKEYFLNNYNNIHLLSNSFLFYQLIELSQLSLDNIRSITILLTKVYIFNFNINYFLNDLSDQFLLRKNECIIHKNNNIIAKSHFLYELFKYENFTLKEQKNFIIKNGFFFNDDKDNGIILNNNGSFIFPNENFSSVISFKLLVNENKVDNNKKYPIYSLSKKQEINDFIIYIENKILKMEILGNVHEIFDDIEYNKTYVLWHFHKGDNKKGTSIFYLNDQKVIKKKLIFKKESYDINIGFEKIINNKDKNNLINQNNFTGIIGTYILFSNCFVCDDNSKKSISFEEDLLSLKFNYEDIIYVNYETKYSRLKKEILENLQKFASDNISRFIEIIISSKSIINIDNNFCNKNKKFYKANYFTDKNMGASISCKGPNIDLNNNLITYPFYFSSTFDKFINNNGIKFLELQLYYFIGVIGSYSLIKNEPTNQSVLDNKLMELKEEKNTLYIKLQNIWNLFLYCFQNMNEVEEKKYENDINCFFITLNNLISLNSKNGFKINLMILTSFLNYLNILISKHKFFEYFGFIFEYENYENDDDKVFEVLLHTLSIHLGQYHTNILREDIFVKLLNFDKLYIDEKSLKSTKKLYSKFIRESLSLSLLNNNEEFFFMYIKRMIDFSGINKKNPNNLSLNCNDITEEDLSEDSENLYNLKLENKKSLKEYNLKMEKISSKSIKFIEEESENNKEELNNLILTYKYMKNLYLCLDMDSKLHNILIKFCLEKDENIVIFFNEEFKLLNEKYDINNIRFESTRKINNETVNYENNFKIDELTNDACIIVNKEKEKSVKIAELIKSLCIRFLDEINYENNCKIITHELKEKKYSKEKDNVSNNSIKIAIKSPINIYKSGSSFSLQTPKKAYKQKNLEPNSLTNLNSAQNLANKKLEIANDSIDSILISKFEFFNTFTVSPYTFNSFFLALFREMTNEKKLKYIKKINKKDDKLFLSEKDFIYTRYFCRIIIQLIQKVAEEQSDNCFIGKLEFFEYVYEQFKNLLMNMLEYYNDKKMRKDKLKPMINNLFCSKENAFGLYLAVIQYLKNNTFNMKDIYIENSQNKSLEKETDNKNLQIFFNKVKQNLSDIIEQTINKLIDPFYFKLLFEIYIKYNNQEYSKFVFQIIEFIIEKFYKYKDEDLSESKRVKYVIEFNNKNLLLLIYKLVFYREKRKFLIKNIKPIALYLVTFLSTKLIFLKLVFPLEESDDSKTTNKKLLIEMLFEIYFELYMEYKNLVEEECDEEEDEKKIEYQNQISMFEEQLMQLLVIKNTSGPNFDKNIFSLFESFSELEEDRQSKKKHKKKVWEYSICYMIDKLSIMYSKTKKIQTINKGSLVNTFDELGSLREYALKKYRKDYSEEENDFSVTILFLIKLSIYIHDLEKYENNSSNLLNFFIKTSELLCEDAQRLQQKYITYNPLVSKSQIDNELYDDFKNYIINEYKLNKKFKEGDLIQKIKMNEKESKKYKSVYYNKNGKPKLVAGKSQGNLLDNRNNFYNINMQNSYVEESSFGKNSYIYEREEHSSYNLMSERVNSFVKLNERKSISSTDLNLNSVKEGFSLFKVSSSFFLGRKEKRKLKEYKIIPKFLKNFVRNYFSSYFIKLLTYDEDFINAKNIYYYLYHKEISDIKKYGLNYPSKLKNRLGNNYVKHFLKKDFNFMSNEYFKYSHKFINKRNFYPKTKNLFPSKIILEEYDFAHKDIVLNPEDKSILSKNCELITYDGSVFGYIYLFQNCILFKSDRKNDKRKIKNKLDCACCCMEFDFLEKDKLKILPLTDIKEVVSRKFLYAWISLEIFMKNGYSHLFNFFNEEANNEILDLFKNNGISVIKNVKEYFDREEFSKKWKEGKISTYNYLLLLNKLSSRTYNDSNQYPIMPWIYLEDKSIRNFDIPMSIQDEEFKEKFLKIPSDSSENGNRWHSNHYSTSAYICYYLMRTSPFTESMIKFQSNNFDVPDRQFFDIGQTLFLCEKNNNNRELIPELYTIPEAYINLNDNDFGKQSERSLGGRIHNVGFDRYGDNAYDFIYNLKFLLNNDEEVNKKINEWFDFIFGINQYNKDNKFGKGLRNFNKFSYGQNIDIKKIISDLKRNKKSESKIYNTIKEILGLVISFGQCPFQLLIDKHPKRIYKSGINVNMPIYYNNTNEQDLFSISSDININQSILNISYNENNETMTQQILYDEKNKKHNIIFFKKSLNNNLLYCICNNKEIEMYRKEKEYKFKKKINVNKNYLLFKKNLNGYPILNTKYLFCELKEQHFIFCRYLENSIQFILPNMESKILLNSFVTSIIRISEKGFITGDNQGNIYHWYIDLDDILNLKLKLLKKVKSNNDSITAIVYNEQLNIVASSDKNTVIIRSFYDFEFLTYININDNNSNENGIIVDIKISNYDLLYILISKDNDLNCILKGYSINGICFGQYKEKITNFDLTDEGRVIVGLANLGMVYVLNPINFKLIYSRFLISKECLFFQFYFEKPNILFLGYKDKDGSKIRIDVLNKDEMKQFI